MLTPKELSVFLDATTETLALWERQPDNRPLFARNLGYYFEQLAGHFRELGENPGPGGFPDLPSPGAFAALVAACECQKAYRDWFYSRDDSDMGPRLAVLKRHGFTGDSMYESFGFVDQIRDTALVKAEGGNRG